MEKYQFVKSLNENRILISKDSEYFVASYSAFWGRPEVLVFRSDDKGNIPSMVEVDGGYGYDMESFCDEKVMMG